MYFGNNDDINNKNEVLHSTEKPIEKAILVGLDSKGDRIDRTTNESLEELELLAETAGAVTVGKVLQHKSTIDSAFHIGKGKAQEVAELAKNLNVDMVIFDDELSGAQIRNLEEIIGIRVIDRSTLILDIFADRAISKEGKIQVELAQLKYRLPRLIGFGSQLSRLGGGIGTRGPGEKKLEVDRRHIKRRISVLEEELEEIVKQRELQRTKRSKNQIPVAALVGYTNAGKSTLMNALSDAGVLAEDKLFATLDPTLRNVTLPNGQEILLADTVGFIRKLPHHLIDAFKSTLEETVNADILLHVIDSSSPEYELQREVVLNILHELGADNKPIITVYNKFDFVDDESIIINPQDNFVKISALHKKGLEGLLAKIREILSDRVREVELLIPYSDAKILSTIYENGKVASEEYSEEGIRVKALIKGELASKFQKYFQI